MSSLAFEKDKATAGTPFGSFSSHFPYWTTVLILIGADVVAFAAASMIFRWGHPVPHIVFFARNLSQHTPTDVFTVVAVVFILVRYIDGDYSRRRLFWDHARATTVSLLFAAIPCFLIDLSVPGYYSLWSEIESWAFLLVAIPTVRHLARLGMNYLGLWRQPTALIATSSRCKGLFDTISNTLTLGCEIRWVALEDYDDAHVAKLETGTATRKPQFLRTNDAQELVRQLESAGCSQAIVATDDMQSESFSKLIHRLMETDISIAFIPAFRRLPLAGVTTSYFFGTDVKFCQIHRHLQRRPNRLLKRTFDIVAAFGLLVLFMPVFAILALCIKAHDRGPVFYNQRRVGMNGKQFGCMKFRTMAVDADARLEKWKIANPELYQEFFKTYKLLNDPRITTPGEWIRKTSLDELPQLFNVLRGEMSLVGPRPIPEYQLRGQYGPAAKIYETVRPGLTGLWQVSGRNNTTWEERVYLDEWYILNWTFWYDIVILVQTAWVVLLRRGAY